MKICLDSGHYGKYNQSPCNSSYYESEVMWKLTNLQKKFLEEYGFEVILTRDDINKDLGLYTRGSMSNGCVLFISNHSNATSSSSVDYPVSYCSVDKKADGIGLILANCVHDTMNTTQTGRISHRYSSNGNYDYYGVLRGASDVGTPSLILEHSFHTNHNATNWLLDDSNLESLAKNEAIAIAEYFGMSKKEVPIGWNKDENGWWYRFGDGTYPKNSWYEVKCESDGLNHWFLFNSNGYMLVGRQEFNGESYYLEEKGDLQGACMVTDDKGKLRYL